MIKTRKATSWKLQSLTSKLNFIAKAVLAGKCFMKGVYQAQAGIPHHRHIDLCSPVLADLRMWKVFLDKFRGWMPITDTKQLHASAVEIFVDAEGSVNLGWGTWLPHKGLWMYGQWEEDFFQLFQPSIDCMHCWLQ